MAPQPVQAPRTQAARLSLVNSSAEGLNIDPDDQRWPEGFSFEPEVCGGAWIEDPCDVVARSITGRPATVEFQPFDVVAGDTCSTLGSQADPDEFTDRARRALERCRSAQVAEEMWEGTLAQSAGWANQYLARVEADTVTTGPSGLIDALACLEQALAEAGCGERGMIHATRQVVTHWAALGNSVLRREGGLLVTAHDTIVVSDAGYTGTGPNGEPADASVWAFATGMVEVRFGPVSVTPETFAEAVAHRVNDVEVYASQPAGYAWDPCAHFAAEVDLAACAIGGTS